MPYGDYGGSIGIGREPCLDTGCYSLRPRVIGTGSRYLSIKD